MSKDIASTDFSGQKPIYNQDRGLVAFPWAENAKVVKWYGHTDAIDAQADEFLLLGNGQGKTWLEFSLDGAAVVDMLDFEVQIDFYAKDKTTLKESIVVSIDPADAADTFAVGQALLEYCPSPRLCVDAPYVKITASSSLVAENATAKLRADINLMLN